MTLTTSLQIWRERSLDRFGGKNEVSAPFKFDSCNARCTDLHPEFPVCYSFDLYVPVFIFMLADSYLAVDEIEVRESTSALQRPSNGRRSTC